MWTKNKIRPLHNSEIHVYDSFFTPEECAEIHAGLLETIGQNRLHTTFYGKQIDLPNGHQYDDLGDRPLPWTNILLDIKQFVEDKLDLEFNTATLTVYHKMTTGTLQNGSLLVVQGEIVVGYFCWLSGPLEHSPIINIVLI